MVRLIGFKTLCTFKIVNQPKAMKNFTKLFVLSLLLLAASQLYAQTDTTGNQDTSQTQKPYLKVGLNYLNNNVFLGRTDTVRTPTLSPAISFGFGSGFYLSGAMDIITNRSNNKLDGGNVEIGYDYTGDGNLEWGASFTKLFFNSTSTRVSASLSSTLSAYIDYDIADVITPALNVSYNISKSNSKNDGKNDILFSPSLSHDFLIESLLGQNDKLLISPQATMNLGSQNFYYDYLLLKGLVNKRGSTPVLTTYSNDLGSVVLLDYELTAPIIYKLGRFAISFTPTLAFAQDNLPRNNAAQVLLSNNIEKSQPIHPSEFYFETGVSFKF